MINRLSAIKMLAMDVDGTLTSGEMILFNGHQIKMFNVYDGLGIRLAMNYGLDIAIITGNTSQAVLDRAKSLGVTNIYQGARYKSDAIKDLAARYNLDKSEIAYVGDDLNDLPAFACAGLTFAVTNAVDELKERADIVTRRAGGDGAVREIIESILTAKGNWEDAVDSFIRELEKEQEGKAGPEAVA